MGLLELPGEKAGAARACIGGALLGVVLAGCSTLQVPRPLLPESPSEVGALAPPLVEAWRYNAEAGFGPDALLAFRGAVLVSTRQGEIHIVDAETGGRVGKQRFGDAVEGAPLVLDGRQIIVPLAAGRYGLAAYDLVGARRLWSVRSGAHVAGLAFVEGTAVAAAYDGTVRGLDPRTGAERWARRPDSLAHFVAAPLVIGGSLVALADDRGRVAVLDGQTGAERWVRYLEAPVHEALATDGVRLFVPTTRGRLVTLDVQTGGESWRLAAADARTLIAAPAVSEATVLVGGSDGRLRALDVQTGDERWSRAFDGNVAAAPAVVDDIVYVGTLDRQLVGLDLETGEERWRTELDGRVKSALVARGDQLYVLAEPRYLYAFRRSAGVASR